jgi:nucleoside-diphosphate-sugar epimerase
VHRGNTPLTRGSRTVEILAERASLRGMRARFRAWSPEVVLDTILSSAPQAIALLETFRGIARRVVAVSSGDVYRAMAILHCIDSGPLEPTPLTEDSALRTETPPYSKEGLDLARAAFPWIDDEYDKVQVEKAIRAEPELPATVLRLPMVYGPGDPLHRLFPIVKRIQDHRPAILYEQSYAQTVPCRGYVENVALAIAMAVASDGASGRTYNVCEPDAITEADWAARIGAVAGWKGRVIAVPRDRAPKHLIHPYRFEQHLFMDSRRIRAELGYVEPIPVDEALRRTIEWEKANPPQQIDPAAFDYPAEDEALARC